MTRRRRPACGNPGAHPAHEYGMAYDANTNQHWPYTCGGWTETEAAATALVREIDAAVLAWLPGRATGAGPVLRLECHASVVSAIRELAEPDFTGFTSPSGRPGEAAYQPLAYADVVVLPLPSGEWRLTAAGEVLASGSLGRGSAADG